MLVFAIVTFIVSLSIDKTLNAELKQKVKVLNSLERLEIDSEREKKKREEERRERRSRREEKPHVFESSRSLALSSSPSRSAALSLSLNAHHGLMSTWGTLLPQLFVHKIYLL